MRCGVPDELTSVPTAVGDLCAIVSVPEGDGPFPGVVLVDGSGDGTAADWGDAPARLVECGFVVLRHDKPGCGSSPGHWMDQTFDDRAAETRSALEVLRAHPAVVSEKCGLYGVSQGGWVALLTASQAPEVVRFVVSVSGPGVGVLAQDRFRVHTQLVAEGHGASDVEEAMAWFDVRARLLLDDAPAAEILTRQQGFAGRPWHAAVNGYFDNERLLGFVAKVLAFEPAEAIAALRCPVLALFGAADPMVPVAESVAVYLRALPGPIARHGIAVLPEADHGLYVTDDPAVPVREQLAPGYLPLLRDFLLRATA